MSLLDDVVNIIRHPVTAPPPAVPAPDQKGLSEAADWSQQPYFVRDQYRYNPLTGASYNTTIDYAAAAGDLGTNGIIVACIGWLMRAEPEAPWKVSQRTTEGVQHPPDHALLTLLNAPNPFYTGLTLRQGTVWSYNLSGNAYWRKVRNAQGRVIELWWEPHTTIRAAWPGDGSEWISHYQVYRGGQWWDIPKADVVHFRDGLDPANPRYGQSRLGAALREVATDNEAARYTYTLLRNQGIPGLIISPASDDQVWTPDEAAMLKASFTRNHTGDERGSVMVPTAAVHVEKISFAPGDMNVDAIRQFPESRVAALLNMPPGLVGLLVGLEHNTYSNMDAAWKMAIMSNLAPYWRVVEETVTHQLMPDLGNPATEYVGHDLTQVKVLQENQDAIYTRMATGWNAGFVKRSEARMATNWPVDPDGLDDVYKGESAAPLVEPLPPVKGTTIGTKAASLPKTESALTRDVAAWLRGVYRDAAGDAPTGKALVHTNGVHHE